MQLANLVAGSHLLAICWPFAGLFIALGAAKNFGCSLGATLVLAVQIRLFGFDWGCSWFTSRVASSAKQASNWLVWLALVSEVNGLAKVGRIS